MDCNHFQPIHRKLVLQLSFSWLCSSSCTSRYKHGTEQHASIDFQFEMSCQCAAEEGASRLFQALLPTKEPYECHWQLQSHFLKQIWCVKNLPGIVDVSVLPPMVGAVTQVMFTPHLQHLIHVSIFSLASSVPARSSITMLLVS